MLFCWVKFSTCLITANCYLVNKENFIFKLRSCACIHNFNCIENCAPLIRNEIPDICTYMYVHTCMYIHVHTCTYMWLQPMRYEHRVPHRQLLHASNTLFWQAALCSVIMGVEKLGISRIDTFRFFSFFFYLPLLAPAAKRALS
jgi:hypothetical protein